MWSAGKSKRLLVTGASGFLGWHLCRQAAARWSVYGVGRRHSVAAEGTTPIVGNLTDDVFSENLFENVHPGAVIHAAAASSPDSCEKHGNASRQINVIVTEKLARLCAGRGIPFVFTSTDLVFDGKRPPYSEDAPTTPLSEYGRQKVEAEQRTLASCPKALICRLPLLIGRSGAPAGNFSIHILEALVAGKPLNLFTDEYRTPVDGESAAAGILSVLGRATGIVHLGGRDRISRYQMGLRLAAMVGCGHDRIRPVSIQDGTTNTPRAPDVSLISERAYGLGYDPIDLDLALKQMVDGLGEFPT